MSAATADTLMAALTRLPNVLVRNPQRVRGKLQKLLDGGADALHLIGDFDMTMTQYWVNGRRNRSAHALFNHFSRVGPSFRDATEALFKKYYPIEVSTTMPVADKVEHMVAWWREAHDLILGLGFADSDLLDMVREEPLLLRTGTEHLIKLCDERGVPLLVFSAGIADVIEHVLRERGLLTERMHVISNRLIMEQGTRKIIGFREPMMHVLNKNEFTALIQRANGDVSRATDKGTPEWHRDLIEHRRNVILVGDSLGDVQMGSGLRHDIMLTVGLLNRYTQSGPEHDREWAVVGGDGGETLAEAQTVADQYADTYDIVLCGDMGFDEWLNPLLQAIIVGGK